MPADDITILGVPLIPFRSGEAPNGLGVKWYAILFDALRRFHPRLAERLHNLQHKPFTISPLLRAADGPPAGTVNEGERYWVRLCFIDTRLPDLLPGEETPRRWLTDVWQSEVLTRLPDRLPMRRTGPSPWDFLVDRHCPTVPPQITTFTTLAQPPVSVIEKWRLEFRSPTSFSLSLPPAVRGSAPQLALPLPDPDLVLRGLAAGWQRWAPPHLAFLAEEQSVVDLLLHLELERYQARGDVVTLSEHERLPAFTGQADFACRSSPGPDGRQTRDSRLHLLATLMRLVPVTGIGVKTARGMGLTTAEPLP